MQRISQLPIASISCLSRGGHRWKYPTQRSDVREDAVSGERAAAAKRGAFLDGSGTGVVAVRSL